MKIKKAKELSTTDTVVCWECREENVNIDGFITGDLTISVYMECGHCRTFAKDENVVAS